MREARRRRGRPPLEEGDTTVRLHVSLPSRLYAALSHRAQTERSTVSEQVRRVLRGFELTHKK